MLDDYGHHPTAIDATISTVRLRYPGRPLILAIEPLTYHRTAALLPALARSCAAADRVAVADIYAVRDTDLTITSAAKLAAAISALGTEAEAPGSVEATADTIYAALPERAVVLVMGGGALPTLQPDSLRHSPRASSLQVRPNTDLAVAARSLQRARRALAQLG